MNSERKQRLKGSFNQRTAPVFLGEGSVFACHSCQQHGLCPKGPLGTWLCRRGSYVVMLRHPTRSAGRPWGGGRQVRCQSWGISLPVPLSTTRSRRVRCRGPAISHSPSPPSHRGGRRALAQADFLYEDNWVCISLVHLSGWNTVSWLILKWNLTPFAYVNSLLVRDGTLSCSNLPAVSVSAFSLPLLSIALNSPCAAVVRNDTRVWKQKLTAKEAWGYGACPALRAQQDCSQGFPGRGTTLCGLLRKAEMKWLEGECLILLGTFDPIL